MFGECEELHNVMAVEEWLGRAAAHGSAVFQHTHIASSNVHILLPLRERCFFLNIILNGRRYQTALYRVVSCAYKVRSAKDKCIDLSRRTFKFSQSVQIF